MTKILKTTLATAFAAACLAGATVTFAADNGNGGDKGGISTDSGKSMNNNDSDVKQTDPNSTGSITCDNNAANDQAGCDQNGMKQQQQQQ